MKIDKKEYNEITTSFEKYIKNIDDKYFEYGIKLKKEILEKYYNKMINFLVNYRFIIIDLINKYYNLNLEKIPIYSSDENYYYFYHFNLKK